MMNNLFYSIASHVENGKDRMNEEDMHRAFKMGYLTLNRPALTTFIGLGQKVLLNTGYKNKKSF